MKFNTEETAGNFTIRNFTKIHGGSTCYAGVVKNNAGTEYSIEWNSEGMAFWGERKIKSDFNLKLKENWVPAKDLKPGMVFTDNRIVGSVISNGIGGKVFKLCSGSDRAIDIIIRWDMSDNFYRTYNYPDTEFLVKE